MSLEENKRLAREAIKIWTTGDLDAADALYAWANWDMMGMMQRLGAVSEA